MLNAVIKFCGGCNPRYERGAAYSRIREETKRIAAFSLPEEGVQYDVLVVLRGCTACSYLYEEEICAAHRLICSDEGDIETIIHQLHILNNH